VRRWLLQQQPQACSRAKQLLEQLYQEERLILQFSSQAIRAPHHSKALLQGLGPWQLLVR
jgi:hypothetical protein